VERGYRERDGRALATLAFRIGSVVAATE